jgi:hypothetical protein
MKWARQRGFLSIEAMAVLMVAIAGMTIAWQWLAKDADRKVNQAAAEHVQVVADATTRWVKDNYSTISAAAAPTVEYDATATLGGGYLPPGFDPVSPFGQSYSIRIYKAAPTTLQTMIVGTGGSTIGELDLRRIAQLVGAKGGYISAADTTKAQGSYGGWAMPFANFGTSPGAGKIVAALFFQDGGAVSDYVYRNAVPGHPELNTMTTPLVMGSVQAVGTSCATTGAISQDGNGAVVSCQSGVWKTQGATYWQDPVATFAALPVCNAASAWQTRVVTSPSVGSGPRPYTCDGSAWQALAINDLGNLVVPGSASLGSATISGTASIAALAGNLQVTTSATDNTACVGEGRIATSSTFSGLILSCQHGIWKRSSGATAPPVVTPSTSCSAGERGNQVLVFEPGAGSSCEGCSIIPPSLYAGTCDWKCNGLLGACSFNYAP